MTSVSGCRRRRRSSATPAAPDFASGSGLRRASSQEGAIVGVEVFARDHGWTDDDEDPRYLRDRDQVGVVTHRTGTECKVYLHT
ncbi:hypothetical protein [Streptomyces sp. NPDC001275]